MKILCIGQTVLDITFPMQETPVENRKYVMKGYQSCVGAPATNASILLAKWGLDVSLISRVGNDLFGQSLLETLKQNHVDTSLIHLDEDSHTSISCILANSENGNRTIFNAPMPESDFSVRWPKVDPDYILIDGRETKIALKALKKYPNAISIMDAGSFKPWTKALAPLVDYFVCSEDLSRTYTGQEINLDNAENLESIFQKLEELTSHTIVITLGNRGLIYKEKDKIIHFPAYLTNTIDSTGAGDIFHGAFVYFLSQRLPFHEVLQMASLTASISTETLGGMTSIPDLKTVYERKAKII